MKNIKKRCKMLVCLVLVLAMTMSICAGYASGVFTEKTVDIYNDCVKTFFNAIASGRDNSDVIDIARVHPSESLSNSLTTSGKAFANNDSSFVITIEDGTMIAWASLKDDSKLKNIPMMVFSIVLPKVDSSVDFERFFEWINGGYEEESVFISGNRIVTVNIEPEESMMMIFK